MGSFDLEALLAPVDQDHPCGLSMVYEAAYTEIEGLAKGTPEQQIGETIKPAEDPEWPAVLDRCTELLGQTKDLRLGTLLCVAKLVTEGWEGVAEGLALLRRTLEQYWDHVHPQLDPEDGNDPTERLNLLESLYTPLGAYRDQIEFIRKLYECPLTDSRQLGRFSRRDIGIAASDERFHTDVSAGEEVPEMATIDGAFEDTPPERLTAMEQAVATAMGEAEQINGILTSKVGPERAPDAKPMLGALAEIRTVLRDQMARRGIGVSTAEGAAGAAESASSTGAAGAASPNSGEIRSREDVRLALERLCRYYANHEPSSPVPLLLGGAKRLVSASYVEVAEYLSPEALKHLSKLFSGGDGG